MHIHNWFYLSRADRKAFALLLVVLIVIVVVRMQFRDQVQDEAKQPTAEEQKALAEFADRQKKDSLARLNRYGWRDKEAAQRAELFSFDPNTADSLTLRRLGLAPWQIRNMMKYRRKGGIWKSADHFARLYGLSEEEFLRLKPFIVIEKEKSAGKKDANTDKKSRHLPKDSVLKYYYSQSKFKTDTLLNLNSTDTTELKRIPGIGSYYARKICSYRERLGGFVNVGQIEEIEGLPENIAHWFTVDSMAVVRRENVNTASFRTLARHPYLTYEQVKLIDFYRKKYGKIWAWRDLFLADEFAQADTLRLNIYFYFK